MCVNLLLLLCNIDICHYGATVYVWGSIGERGYKEHQSTIHT